MRKESQNLLESFKNNLNEGFNYNFTNENEFGSVSNTDALNTIEDLAKYFEDYATRIKQNMGYYIDNQNVMSEVSDLLYQVKQKLVNEWNNQ